MAPLGPHLDFNSMILVVLHDEGDETAVQGIESAVKFLAQNPTEGVTVDKNYMVAVKPSKI